MLWILVFLVLSTLIGYRAGETSRRRTLRAARTAAIQLREGVSDVAPVRLKGPRLRWMFMLAVSLTAVYFALPIVVAHPAVGGGLLLCVFVGIGVAALNVLPGRNYLELDAEGMLVAAPSGRERYRWNELADPHPVPGFFKRVVAFKLARDGSEHVLPATFGLDAGDLALVLEAYRSIPGNYA